MNEQLQSMITKLYSAIDDGSVVQDGKLFTERELCEKFGVKRGIIQKAIVALETLGIVETKERIGTVIVDHPERLLSNTMTLLSGHSPLFIHNEAFGARLLLEPNAAAIAAERCTDEQAKLFEHEIQFLKDLKERADTPPDKKAEMYNSHNVIFHNLIFDVVNNVVLTQINTFVSGLSRDVFAIFGRLPSAFQPYSTWPDELSAEHSQIGEAIIAHRPDDARAAMAQHLIRSRERNDAKISASQDLIA